VPVFHTSFTGDLRRPLMSPSTERPDGNQATLDTLHFDNRQLRVLPVNPDKSNLTIPTGKVSGARAVGWRAHCRASNIGWTHILRAGACFSRATPTPLQSPVLVATSTAALDLIDLSPEEVRAWSCQTS
jgi:hypothetical protein